MEFWQGGPVILAEESLKKAIRGKRIAMMVNSSAIHNDGRFLMDIIVEEKWAEVAFFLGIEHGIRNDLENEHDNLGLVDPKTGIPIVNLYRYPEYRPPVEELRKVDAVLYCAQDSGVRHWTFTPWMQLLLQSAAEAGCEVIIVDRPNPLRGDIVEGKCTEKKYEGTILTGYDYPLRHGMTIGELAMFHNDQRKLGLKLTVLRMEGWRRDMWYSDTGLMWLPPTPNISTPERLLPYLTLGLLQGSNLALGHQTVIPFEWFGHPDFVAEDLAKELNSRGLPDVYFAPRSFMSTTWTDRKTLIPCRGVVLLIKNRDTFRAVRTQLHIMDALVKLYPEIVDFEASGGWARPRMGTDDVFDCVSRGESILSLIEPWEADAAAFEEKRKPYLLY